MEAAVQLVFFKNKEYYITHCPACGLSVHGSSMNFALYLFEDSIEIILNDLAKKGILITRLLELGWTIDSSPQHLLIPPYFTSRQKLIEDSSEKESDFLTCIDVKITVPCSVNSLFSKSRPRSSPGYFGLNLPGFNGNKFPYNLN